MAATHLKKVGTGATKGWSSNCFQGDFWLMSDVLMVMSTLLPLCGFSRVLHRVAVSGGNVQNLICTESPHPYRDNGNLGNGGLSGN